MTETALLKRPRSIAGSALDAAIARHLAGWGFDVVYRPDDDVFDRLAIVPHAMTTDGFIVDAIAASHISAAMACAMPIDLIYLDPSAWIFDTRLASMEVPPAFQIATDSDVKKIDGAVKRTGRLCGRSLKRPMVSFTRPLLTLAIELRPTPRTVNAERDDLRQAHILDYM
ncbi:MAG: hypothetical protein K2Z25_19330 [Beijerinckiaceae bacterium]|nr:hypothetical protein [Beijerinckiaceae bacterium]